MKVDSTADLNAKDRYAIYYGSTDIQMDIYNRSKDMYKWNNLNRKVCHPNNIMFAIKRLSNNSGRNTPGPDGWKYVDFVKKPINEIQDEVFALLNTREHLIRQVEIPKANGKTRTLGIANINVRIAQQCILNILECVLEPYFSPRSYGFRRDKSTKTCVSSIVACLKQYKNPIIYDCDLKGYFDTIELDRCIYFLRKNHNIYDSTLLRWIRNIMHCSIDGRYTGIGLAQGSILGPVLANVMLHDWEEKLARINGYSQANKIGKEKNTFLDNASRSLNKGTYESHYKKRRKKNRIGTMFRYADDFVIISNNEIDLQQIICRFKQWCKKNKLEVNEEKSKIVRCDDKGLIRLDFLGYGIKVNANKQIIIHIKNETKKIREIKKHLRKCLRLGRSDLFMSSLLGYINYYDINTNVRKLCQIVNNTLYYGQVRSYGCNIKKIEPGTFEIMSSIPHLQYRGKPQVCNVWNFRNMTSKSYKEYLVKKSDWEPKEMYGGVYSWVQEVLKHQVHEQDARLTCFIPGMVMMRKTEPILGVPYNTLDPSTMEIHHKIPIKYGGTNEFSNLVLLDRRSHLAIHHINRTINTTRTKILQGYRKLAKAI